MHVENKGAEANRSSIVILAIVNLLGVWYSYGDSLESAGFWMGFVDGFVIWFNILLAIITGVVNFFFNTPFNVDVFAGGVKLLPYALGMVIGVFVSIILAYEISEASSDNSSMHGGG